MKRIILASAIAMMSTSAFSADFDTTGFLGSLVTVYDNVQDGASLSQTTVDSISTLSGLVDGHGGVDSTKPGTMITLSLDADGYLSVAGGTANGVIDNTTAIGTAIDNIATSVTTDLFGAAGILTDATLTTDEANTITPAVTAGYATILLDTIVDTAVTVNTIEGGATQAQYNTALDTINAGKTSFNNAIDEVKNITVTNLVTF